MPRCALVPPPAAGTIRDSPMSASPNVIETAPGGRRRVFPGRCSEFAAFMLSGDSGGAGGIGGRRRTSVLCDTANDFEENGMSLHTGNPAGGTMETRRPRSVRMLLLVLVMACLLPGIIGALAIFRLDFREGRVQLEKDTIQTSRALAQAVDHQIQQVQALAAGLATANPLQEGDFAGFHERARRLLERGDLGAVVVVCDPGGQQLLNTGVDFGRPLPLHGNPELIRRVVASGRPAVSDLFASAVFGRQVMNVAVPVFVGERLAYVITVSMLPQDFAEILNAQGLPPGWVATILDGRNVIVARSREFTKYSGEMPAEDFLLRRGGSDEGSVEFVMKDGVSVLSVFTRSSLTRWSVAINIPLETLEAQLFRRLTLLAFGVSGLFAIGIALAWLIAGRIAGSFAALRAAAFAWGKGDAIVPPHLAVREAAEVGDAMAAVSERLRQRTADLQSREEELASRTAALRQSEIRLHTLTRHAPAAIAIFDREMRYLAVSRRWCENYGLADEQLLGRSHYEVFPDLPERWKEAHQRGLAGEVLSSHADCFERDDGSVIWLQWELWPWHDDQGAVGGIVVASEDITARRASEIALQESETRFRLMADCAPALIWLAGADGLASWFNRPWLAFTGRTLDEAKGAGWLEGVHPEERDACLRTYHEAFSRHEPFAAQYRLRRHDGRYRWIADHGVPRFEADGILAGYVGACIDITEMKEAREGLERLNAELERRVEERTADLVAANRQLEGFTFAASHDLRGPLGRISSFSTLLERQYADRLSGNGLLFLQFIRQNVERLERLVDDLLDHARIARQDLELQPLSLGALTRDLLQERADEIARAGAQIHLQLEPARALGDPHAFRQALGNLLENAIKYSAGAMPPVIEVGCRAEDGHCRLWVRDNGIGFDMAYHDRIFEIFRRLHSDAEYPGSGVGLALVKCAVERMNGSIWAESEPGRGATFFIELPAVESEPIPAELPA